MKSMDLVIGLDLGTTTCKALVVRPDGSISASASNAYNTQSHLPSWAEQDPAAVWQTAAGTLRSLTTSLSAPPTGLSLSGAMHSLLPVTEDGTPLAAAMTWADTRAKAQASALSARTGSHAAYSRTGCPLQPIYNPARLLWFRENNPEVFGRAAYFVSLKDWVLFKLTGKWATDIGFASTTGLLDIRSFEWDGEMVALAGVSSDRLPALVSPKAIVGAISSRAAEETGLPGGLPVVAGGSDGGLANLGSGAVTPGQVVISVGTTGAIRKVVDKPYLDRSQRTWCYVLMESQWFAGGAINNAGLTLQWVRDRFYPDIPGDAGYERLLAEAAAVPPGAGGVLVLPYFTGERSPYWKPDASGLIYGLKQDTTRGQIARAALEGVAFCLADVWEALAEESQTPEHVSLTGSVTRMPLWAGIISDVLGLQLHLVNAADASALGAAIIGHMGLGNISRAGVIPAPDGRGNVVRPDPGRHQLYRQRHKAFRGLCVDLINSAG
jgi:gluconokinase